MPNEEGARLIVGEILKEASDKSAQIVADAKKGFTAYYQGKVATAGIMALAKRPEVFAPGLMYTVIDRACTAQ